MKPVVIALSLVAVATAMPRSQMIKPGAEFDFCISASDCQEVNLKIKDSNAVSVIAQKNPTLENMAKEERVQVDDFQKELLSIGQNTNTLPETKVEKDSRLIVDFCQKKMECPKYDLKVELDIDKNVNVNSKAAEEIKKAQSGGKSLTLKQLEEIYNKSF
jgi:hypothetical protein